MCVCVRVCLSCMYVSARVSFAKGHTVPSYHEAGGDPSHVLDKFQIHVIQRRAARMYRVYSST